MNNVCAVYKLECAQNLPADILDLLFSTDLRPDHSMQVSLHQLKDDVHVQAILCFPQINYLNNVPVFS